MNSEEIRAEVTERLARAEYMKDRETIPDMLGMTTPPPVWEDATDGMRQEHRRFVAHLVDALGDLLPTGREFAVRWTDGGCITRRTSSDRADVEEWRHRTFYGEPFTIESLWTHDWQEVPE